MDRLSALPVMSFFFRRFPSCVDPFFPTTFPIDFLRSCVVARGHLPVLLKFVDSPYSEEVYVFDTPPTRGVLVLLIASTDSFYFSLLCLACFFPIFLFLGFLEVG